MPKTKFKMDKNLHRLLLAVDPKKMDATLRRNLRRSTAIVGRRAAKAARKVIEGGKGLDANAALTQAIKGENAPLKGTSGADLYNAITSKVVSDTEVFVGVLRRDKVYNVAKTVHDGKTIKVTKAMRGMFFYLWKASIGDMDPSDLTGRAAELWEMMPGGWKRLAPDTTTITIPPRPFMDIAFKDPALKKAAEREWALGVQRAMRERAGGR